MKKHRSIILIVGSLAALVVVPADAASASSLLSGYGGPGQGNQAILGSALLNGPGGGSGSGSSGAGSQSGTGAPVSGETAASGSGSSGTSGTAAGGSGSSRGGAKAAAPGQRGQRSASRSSAAPSIAAIYDAAERAGPAPSTGTLGLSASELLLIVLALAMLVLVGALSRRLTRAPPARGARAGGG